MLDPPEVELEELLPDCAPLLLPAPDLLPAPGAPVSDEEPEESMPLDEPAPDLPEPLTPEEDLPEVSDDAPIPAPELATSTPRALAVF